MTPTETTTPHPPALPAHNRHATPPESGSTLARLCAQAPQWGTPTFEEIVRFEYAPSPAQHSSAYLHALHVIYFVRDVKVKQLEEALRKHAEDNTLRDVLWPSITMRPVFEKAIAEAFENAECEAAQLRKQCDGNTDTEPVKKVRKKKTQPAPELTCEGLQRQWGVTVVRSAVSGIKDAGVAVLYDDNLRTIEKQHNRQPLRKRKHDAD